ncbi:putative methyltransferase-domain-containing protein [Massariosphaeria phaeospora]|uniref:Protein N-terminal and lysine N-methyltransferase EFM7 n=1 Tax=Massariosphaeria phaeospora TaxID=100035 RepID=A0A7C8MF12_9PLEO|nr:putative methyltransferase-domain-containing protein [Massariosphaeria phaeospora]
MAADAGEDVLDLFQEPSDYYQSEKPATFASHQLLSGQDLCLRLVGHNPLWGHFLWNAGRTVSAYLEERADDLVKGKTVLELGAGGGLPSLVCALKGAVKVVVTDYPDADLIDNLRHNINHCKLLPEQSRIVAEGYLWGASTRDLTKHTSENSGFDVLILADLLFNHSEHGKLVQTVQLTLRKSPASRAYVFFTPYRPWLLQKDLAFFDLAREAGFTVDRTFEKVMDKVMFDEDPGDELLRRTVYGYELSWPG